MVSQPQRRTRPVLVVAGVLVAGFGYLAILSVGFPFVVAGLLLVVAGLTDAHRQQPATFWPFTVAVAAFFAGYVLVAPLSCTSSVVAVDADAADDRTGEEPVGTTACTNLLGIDYAGGVDYDPPRWPAVLAGVAAAAAFGTGTRRLLADRQETAT